MICMGRAVHLMDTLGTPAARVVTPYERAQRIFSPSGAPLRFEDQQDESAAEDWFGV